MKIRSRTPWGYRVLGLVALSGMSLAVEAEEKIVLLTSWYAQAEQGGYYQAQATGIYKKYGLEVDIRSGGPQVNGMQLLLSKRADVIIGYDLQLLEGIQRGFQAKAIAAPFQYDPQGLLTHTDVASLEGLKGKTILVSSSGQATWWPWLKGQYQLNDAQARPYTFNIQPFVADDNVAQQAYVSSEVFQVQKAGVKLNFFLFSEHGYPPYGGILIAFVHDLGLTADSHSVLIGGSLVFGCAITYAIYNAGAEVAIGRIGAIPFSMLALLVSIAATQVHFFATRPVAALNLPWQVYAYSAGMAVFSTVMPIFWLSSAIHRIGAAKAVLIGLIGPILTILFSWWLLDEPLSVEQLLGTGLVVCGLLVVIRR